MYYRIHHPHIYIQAHTQALTSGEVFLVLNHVSMLHLSYVFPSAATTGSLHTHTQHHIHITSHHITLHCITHPLHHPSLTHSAYVIPAAAHDCTYLRSSYVMGQRNSSRTLTPERTTRWLLRCPSIISASPACTATVAYALWAARKKPQQIDGCHGKKTDVCIGYLGNWMTTRNKRKKKLVLERKRKRRLGGERKK